MSHVTTSTDPNHPFSTPLLSPFYFIISGVCVLVLRRVVVDNNDIIIITLQSTTQLRQSTSVVQRVKERRERRG